MSMNILISLWGNFMNVLHECDLAPPPIKLVIESESQILIGKKITNKAGA